MLDFVCDSFKWVLDKTCFINDEGDPSGCGKVLNILQLYELAPPPPQPLIYIVLLSF
jgi:hypothetical protein